jgi:hypothetical protein
MHRDGERDACRSLGLLRSHREHAVADMLAPHAHDIATPLCGVETVVRLTGCQREPHRKPIRIDDRMNLARQPAS